MSNLGFVAGCSRRTYGIILNYCTLETQVTLEALGTPVEQRTQGTLVEQLRHGGLEELIHRGLKELKA